MHPELPLEESLPADSFLEYAFVRWLLAPAVHPAIRPHVVPQQEVTIGERTYRIDYAISGQERRIAVELDGFAYHGSRAAFSYDRLRQNELQAAGWIVLRFTYDAIRCETARSIAQLQALLATDPLLRTLLILNPQIEQPAMDPEPRYGITPAPKERPMTVTDSYFASMRTRLNIKTLRDCQTQALAALTNYYSAGRQNAACVMAVGAGKTALGIVSALAFTQRRALIVTPGSVIRGTFDKALDYQAVGNVLYGLPGGPLIPGCTPPRVCTLDREEGPIRSVDRQGLLSANIIITNFHTLGTGVDEDDLLAKLAPDDIDYIVVDEAHIAAADSYRRLFAHFAGARRLLMSACFQRLDGKPIDADVVYRYRLIDSIVDGNAKNLRVQRFVPRTEETVYEMVWPDGRREEIAGRDALLEILGDDRKLSSHSAQLVRGQADLAVNHARQR